MNEELIYKYDLSLTDNPPLWQRGVRGDFMNYKSKQLFFKNPLYPSFSKGEYKFFIFPCEPKIYVIPAKAGIQKHTGFRVKHGITEFE
jgi:hypothetical protein